MTTNEPRKSKQTVDSDRRRQKKKSWKKLTFFTSISIRLMISPDSQSHRFRDFLPGPAWPEAVEGLVPCMCHCRH
jgi:hypothetical protein